MSISLLKNDWATAPVCSPTSVGGQFLGGSTNSSIITTSLWYFGDLSFSNTLFFPTPTSQGAGIVTFNMSGTPLWIARFDSTGNDNNVQTSMNNTHVFSIGSFQANTLTISGIVISGNSSYTSAFITAYTVNGSIVTAKSITATAAIRGYTIKVHNNIIYVGGFYNSALTIDSKSIPGPTGQGSFVAAFNFDTSFNCLWLNGIDSTGFDIATTLTITNNRLFVGGSFNGTLTIGSYTINSITGAAYIAAYNLSGQIQNLIKIDTNGADNLFGLDASNGRLYSAGIYNGSLTIGSYTLPAPSSAGIYVACFDTSLNPLWLTSIDSSGTDAIEFNILSANSNFCFVNITYTGSITIGKFSFPSPPVKGILIATFDKYGNVVDVRIIDPFSIPDSHAIFSTDNYVYSTIRYTNSPNIPGTLLPSPLSTPPSGRQLPLLISYTIAPPINQTPLLSAQSISGGVRLLWNSITNATDYRIYYGLSGSGFTNYTPNINDISYTILSLVPGSFYQFTIVTLYFGNESPYSNILFRTPLPLTPSTFNITSGVQKVDLTWSTVSGATGYRIYYGLSGMPFSMYQDFVNVSVGTISGLTSGLAYNFYIISYNDGGESTPSSSILSSIPLSPTPLSFSAAASNLSVTLSWSASEGATGYRIYYGITGTYNLSGIFYSLSASISGLNANIPYNFRISAFNDGGESPLSSPIYATPLPMPPSTPSDLSATSGILITNLSWTSVSGATGYKITYGLYNIFDNDIIVGDISSYTVINLLPDLSYGFIISAFNSGGFSPISTPPLYTIPAPPIPTIPIDFTGAQNVKSVNLSWTNTAYSYDYIIKYSLSGALIDNTTIFTSGSQNNLISGLSGETEYKFAISARNRTGQSAFSPYIYVSPWTVRPIQKPYFIESTAFRSQIRLKISDIYNATYFVIYYGKDGEFTNQFIVTREVLINNNGTINVQYLKENTLYNFSIIAFNDETLSLESDIISIKTLEIMMITGEDASFVTAINDYNTVYQFELNMQQQRINQFKPMSAVDRLKYIQGLVRDAFIPK
jgi:hypothetical protein